MKLCSCTHDETCHAEDGIGYCFATKRNGEPCECERFSPGEELQLLQETGPRIIEEAERRLVESCLRTAARNESFMMGAVPIALVIFLPPDWLGPRRPIVFELVYDGGTWVYRADGEFEIAGIPGESWSVPL